MLTLHDFAQLWVAVFGALSIYCVARTDRWHRWGYVFGLVSEPGWFYAAWAAEQWGVFLLAVWWSWWWADGAWRRFKSQ